MDKMLILLLMAILGGVRSEGLLRLNAGIIFNKLEEKLVNGHSYVTFQMAQRYAFRDMDLDDYMPLVNETLELELLKYIDLGFRAKFLEQAEEIDRAILTLHRHIKFTTTNINYLLSNPIEKNRHKRALMGFLGKPIGALFGWADADRVEAIYQKVCELNDFLVKSKNVQTKTTDLITRVIDKQTTLFSMINQQKNIISTTIDKLESDLLNKTKHLMININENFNKAQAEREALFMYTQRSHYLAELNIIYSEMIQTESAIRLLSSGYLSVDVLPPKVLKQNIDRISTELQLSSRGSKLEKIDLEFYYRERSVLFFYSKSHIFLNINLVASNTKSTFDIYQIQSIPVPLNTSFTPVIGYSELNIDYDFLAVSEDRYQYIQLTSNDLLTCSNTVIRVCENPFMRRKFDSPSCAMAVFQDKNNLEKYCNSTIYPFKTPSTQAIAVKSDEYLLTTNKQFFIIECTNLTPVTKRAKSYQLIKLSCHCHLLVEEIVIVNKKVNCEQNYTFYEILKLTNLPLQREINPNSTFKPSDSWDSSIDIGLNLFDSENYTKAMQRKKDLNFDDNKSFNLKPFMKSLKEDTDNLNITPISHVLNSKVSFFDLYKLHTVINYVALGLSMMSMTMCIYLCKNSIAVRMSYLAAPTQALGILHSDPSDKLEIPPSSRNMPNNSKTFDPIEVLTNTLSDEHNLTYFLIILLLVLVFCHIYKFVSKCRKKRTTSMAYIKLRCYTSGSTQNITLASLPTEIRFISSSKICPPMGYTRINSCGTITLRPNWVTPLILDHDNQKTKFNMPSKIVLFSFSKVKAQAIVSKAVPKRFIITQGAEEMIVSNIVSGDVEFNDRIAMAMDANKIDNSDYYKQSNFCCPVPMAIQCNPPLLTCDTEMSGLVGRNIP